MWRQINYHLGFIFNCLASMNEVNLISWFSILGSRALGEIANQKAYQITRIEAIFNNITTDTNNSFLRSLEKPSPVIIVESKMILFNRFTHCMCVCAARVPSLFESSL